MFGGLGMLVYLVFGALVGATLIDEVNAYNKRKERQREIRLCRRYKR